MVELLVVFAIVVAGIAAVGVAIGLLAAPALTRLLDRDEEIDGDR